ncbi:MAG: NAD(+)/NADH kinase [Mycoplasmatales bacterium]
MRSQVFFRHGIDYQPIIDLLISKYEVEIVDEKPDYVFTFGGDGTFLEAVQLYKFDPVYIPINMGNLGFYTSYVIDELDRVFCDIHKNHQLKASVLDVKIEYDDFCESYFALNEATLINPVQTLISTIVVENEVLEHFRGTGICISTPTGSTAYNKSLGGAIVDPELPVYQLTMIAPINNVKYRTIDNSIILSSKTRIRLKYLKPDIESSIITIDRNAVNISGSKYVSFAMSEKKIKILVRHDFEFWSRLRLAFIKEK